MVVGLQDQKAQRALLARRRSLRLPSAAADILRTGLNELAGAQMERAWMLPLTRLQDEVEHYRKRHAALSLKSPLPKLRSSIDQNSVRELCLRVEAALQLADLARSADDLVKPILAYYSCAQLTGVLTRVFFEWQQDPRGHGLRWAPKSAYRTKDSSRG